MALQKQHYRLTVAVLVSFQLGEGWNKGIIQTGVLGSSSSSFTSCSTHESWICLRKGGWNKVRMIESDTIMNDNINVSIQQIDEWISGASQCKLLPEADVKAICDLVTFISLA